METLEIRFVGEGGSVKDTSFESTTEFMTTVEEMNPELEECVFTRLDSKIVELRYAGAEVEIPNVRTVGELYFWMCSTKCDWPI